MEISNISLDHNIIKMNDIPFIMLKANIFLLEINKNKEYHLHLSVYSEYDQNPIYQYNYTVNQENFKFDDNNHLYKNYYALAFETDLPLNITKSGIYFIEVRCLEEPSKTHRISFYIK